MGHCLHEEIEETSTPLAGSTRVSRRVTRQGGLTRLDYRFHVNAYKHLTAKGLPAAVIQLPVKAIRGRVKRPLGLHSPSVNQEPISWSIQLHYIPVTAFSWLIFRTNFPMNETLVEALTNHKKRIWRHCVNEPELPFFHKRKGILKIDGSVKMLWHRLSIGVVCSYFGIISWVNLIWGLLKHLVSKRSKNHFVTLN